MSDDPLKYTIILGRARLSILPQALINLGVSANMEEALRGREAIIAEFDRLEDEILCPSTTQTS